MRVTDPTATQRAIAWLEANVNHVTFEAALTELPADLLLAVLTERGDLVEVFTYHPDSGLKLPSTMPLYRFVSDGQEETR